MGKKRNRFRLALLCTLLFFSSSVLYTPFIPAESQSPMEPWKADWNYHQQITLPIQTDSNQAIHQPIDIPITFDYTCWGINETHHSIRVCSWNNGRYEELELQIYNIEKSDDTTIISCNLVFLIPPSATGDETYFVFYDDTKKEAPEYKNRVQLYDKYYHFEPISGLSVEGNYYEIQEDGYVVYGVGQKGQVLNRYLSQIAIRMKPGEKRFDMTKTDVLASFSFAYQEGPEETDEVASDQELISKEILVDGNLMVRFRITSKSHNNVLFTSNIYTYYYQPGEDKRISVHVHHEVREEAIVSGEINVDGRFGTIISYNSKSAIVDRMVFGEILPYLYVPRKDGIYEYFVNINPSSPKREWAISYKDACTLGPDAWLAYGEGETGKTHGLIFSSHTGIVHNATHERDGIQIKVAEREYLNVMGAEVDYVSIAFGRNSYTPGRDHDLTIDKGLIVQFDVEFYTTQSGGYKRIQEESSFFQRLVAFRDVEITDEVGDVNIHTLTVIPHLSSRIFSFPLLRNITGFSLPVLTAELYQNETLLVEKMVEKPLIGVQYFRFPKLEPGRYHVKIYRLLGDNEKKYIGFGAIDIVNDVTLHVYCTWEQKVTVSLSDQFGNSISNVSIEVWQGTHLVSSAQSTSLNEVVIPVPFNLFKTYQTTDLRNVTLEHLFQRARPYVLKCHYKGFRVYENTLDLFSPSAHISFALYDVIIEVTDALDLPPDVSVVTRITSDEMSEPIDLYPSLVLQPGRFQFSSIPQASYNLRISFAGYMNEKTFFVPDSGPVIPIQFLALSTLTVQPLTSRGERVNQDTFKVSILRNGNEISAISTDEEARLPPGSYVVLMYDSNRLIGSEFVELTFDKTIPIVTILPSMIYAVVTLIGVFVLAYAILFFYFKKISLNTALKLVILGVVLVGFLQPWWTFSGASINGDVEKTSDMYLYPQAMIEEYHVHEYRYLSLATIPELFTDFIETLLFIILGGMCLLIASFIPNVILKKRYAFVLSACGVIFLLLVSIAFIVGMTQIAELTLGSLQGSAPLQISPPLSSDVMVSASWGLGPGFYIVSLGACIAIFAGILDFINKHEIISKLKRNMNNKSKKEKDLPNN